MHKRSLLILCLSLLILAHLSVYANSSDRSSIVITGNDQFTFENGVTSGSGTSEDPYIIENWTIDAQNGNGISIFHTTAHFIIRNCTIFNGIYGIYMWNVTNGRIENCTIYNNQNGNGISLMQISNMSILNNTFYNNAFGIEIKESHDILLINNNFSRCWNIGIDLFNSNSINIRNNTYYNNKFGIYIEASIYIEIVEDIYQESYCGVCSIYSNNINISNSSYYDNDYGIYLYYSNNTNLNNNSLSNCGIFIIGYDNQLQGNTVNGREILYLEDVSDQIIENQNIGQAILVNCSNIILHNLEISRASIGIMLFDSRNCNISNSICYENYIDIFIESSYDTYIINNTCYNSSYSAIFVNNSLGTQLINNTCYDGFPFSNGIYLNNSINSNICNNTCYNNYYSIYLCKSSNSTICNNTCYNSFCGISLENSDYNELFNNTCHNNNQGILIYSSKGNDIHNNECFNNYDGIVLQYCFNENFIHQNTCYNNENNGINLLYCNNNIIENNTCYNNYNGINLDFSNNNTLCRNYCYNNTYIGIRLYSCDNNTLCNNNCYNNQYGIYLDTSNQNIIRNNFLYNNTEKDLEIVNSSGNIVEIARMPITITGNDQFTFENGVTSGSGTSEDPYIIENWTIDAQNGNGISIFHTTAHFIIRNCTIFNGIYGIYMWNVTNGRIENCTIYNNQYGIFFNQSYSIIIENSSCFNNNQSGLYIQYSENITLNRNTLYNNINGISLLYSNNNTIRNNICYNNQYGISLENSNYNYLLNNDCYQNTHSGIYIRLSNNNTAISNTCYNNYCGIFLSSSHYNRLINNDCYNNHYGIFLSNSDENSLIYNYLYNNSEKDLELVKSSNNTVRTPYVLPPPIDLPIFIKRADFDSYGKIANNGSHAIVVWQSNSSGNYDIWAYLIELCSMKRIATWQLTNDTNSDIYPFVTFIDGNKILVTWSSNRSGLYQIYYKLYINGSWTEDSQLTNGNECLHSPIIQLINGSLAIAYTSYNSEFYDVWFSLLRLNETRLEILSSQKVTNANETMMLLPNSILQNEDGKLWIFIFDAYRYKSDFGETTQIYYYCSEDLQNWTGDLLIEGSGLAYPSAVLLPNGNILIVFEGDDGNLEYTGWYVIFDGTYCSYPRLLLRGKTMASPCITYVSNMNIIMISYLNWTNATYKTDLFFSYIPLPPVHAPILITGNDQFTFENGVTSGSGTSEDPYIIENWIIYAWTGDGISIYNTTAHFIIRNCTILYGGIKDTPYFDGIRIVNVSNGIIDKCGLCMDYYGIVITRSSNLYIINNTFQGNSRDIHIYNSEKAYVIDNTCYDDNTGIWVGASNGILIRRNTLHNNTYGIYISDCNGIYIGGNYLRNNTYGINIYNSSECEVNGNICQESDISIFNSNNNRITNNICSEGLNGIYLRNSNNSLISGNKCYNVTYYGISIFDSNLIKISNNNCNWSGVGIYLQRSNSSTIEDNECLNCNKGIQIYKSEENWIESNDFFDCGIGILLEDSKDTRIRYNNCNGCSTGITLSNSHDNGIYHNTCYNCGSGIHLSYSDSNTLNHNTCNNCEDGISIQGSESNHLESNNCCENYHGIYLTESRENDILNNICCNNNSSGIYLKNSVDNYIHGNECNNNDYGIYLTESDSNTIFNNECLNNFYCGIYVEWSEWNHIRNNECKNNAITYLRIEERIEAGITLFHSNHSKIVNNVCEDNVNHGICLAYSHENEVGLNYCRYNSLYGIYLYYSNGNTLHGNICSHNDQGIVMYESDGNSVYNNRISNNDHGINAGRAFSLNEIYENEIYYNNYAIYLNNSRNDTIRNNIIYENNYGIYLSNSSYNIILNNIFFDNNVNLIEVGECSGNQKPPIITSFIPGRNALIAQNNYYVMANYTDEDGINATAVHLIFDNIDVTNSSDVTTSYIRYDFTVDDGFHSIALYIEDNTGNSIWFNWTFTVDTTPPSVIIISPQNITYTTSYIPINVSVQDLSNVSCVIAEINGITNYTLILFNGYYVNSSLVSLNQGSNIIKIYANDTLNNFNSSQYVVCTIDEVPPQVISIIPANNSYIAQNSYYVIVNYTDASGVNSSAVRIFFDNVNITDYSIITFEYAEYNFTEVSDGPHTVAILLVDNVGNAQWFNWTFYVDTTPPSIVVISPMPNQTVDRGDIEIIASISDSISGLSLPSICIFVDENNVTSFATINQTHVSYTPLIPLQDGIHKVNITVADMLGNTITTSWSFMVDAPLSYAYIYMNQTGGATIFIGTPVAFDIKAYNIHDYGKSGIVFTLYVADVPVYTTPATNESGITSFVYVFNTIPGGTIYAMNGSISTNTTSLIVTLPPLPIPDEIILTANATNIQAGDTVLFVISAKKSGNPLSGTYVDLYVNDMYIKRFGPTDESGNLTYIRLFPAIGSYNFFAKSYDGSIQSSILTINVTAPPPIEITSTLETDMPSNITLDRDLFASSFMLVANTTTNASISIVLTNETIPGVNTFNSFNLSIEKSDPTASVNITINFKVTQEWIITNNIDKFTVTLYHFNGSHWNPLPTDYIGEDETFVYYSALATSLSPFAAGGNSIVDNTPPTFSGWSPTNNTIVTTARPTIVVNYTDNIGINLTTIVFKLDGQDVTVSVVKSLTGVSYTPFADLLQGSHTVYVSVNDTSNNMNFTTWYFTIDSMPPYLISYTPANYSYLSTQIINITLLVNDTISPINTNSIVFKIDGITRDPSLSGSFATGWIINYTINLLDGFHNVTVDISDIQNNTATFVIFFYVDTTPPIISSLYPANNTIIGNNRPTISCNYTDAISGISISSIKLYVDNVNVTEYASIDSTGISYTPIANLSDGLHNVALYVTDVVGNEIWSNWSFSIDTSAPIIYSISPTPGSVVTTLTPIISANYSDPNGIQSVKILINGSDVTSLSTVTTSGITYIPTALMNDSYYTVFLFVNDTLNNCATIEWTFFVAIPDTVPPTIFSLSPSDGSTITTKMPTISASFSDNVAIDTTSVIIKVDGVDVTANSIITQTGFSYTPPVALSEGSHTVYVFVKDTSNNQATKTWSFTISIPTPPPVLPPTPTPVPSTTTSIIFSIVANTPTLVDIGGQAPESSIRTIELITNESFSSLQIIAEEYSNNPTSIPLPIEITPISFIKIELNVPSNVVTQATIRFRVSKSSLFSLDPSSIQLYRLDTTWTGLPTSLIAQDDSYYYFEATLSGFSYFAIGAKSLVPDAIPPTIISFSPEGIIFNQRPVIYIKYYDNVGIALFSIRLLIDGIDVTSLAILNSSMTMYIPIANLSEGAHSIYFEVKDTSGNIATATWSFTIKLPDTTPPIIYSVYPSNGSLIYETALVINAHYSDDVGIDISSIILSIDDSIVIPTKLNSSYVEYAAIFNVGSHTISLTVKDTSGNIATATWSFTIKLPDTTPPKISIISPLNGTILSNKSITINASYSDDVEIDITSITLKLDGRDVTAYSIITPISIIYSTTLEEGSHTISLTVKDTSGNIATATWSFTIAIPIDYTLYIIVILAIVALGSIILILKRVKP